MANQNATASGQAIDQILAQPLNGLRIAVADNFLKEGVSAEDFNHVIEQIQKSGIAQDREEAAAVKGEIANVQAATPPGG